MTCRSVRTLLRGLVDYAGLFPPAELGMEEAVAEYARCRRGPDAWILGRFVVPASRVGELAEARSDRGIEEPWPASVLAGERPAAIPDPMPEGLVLESVELRASTSAGAERVLDETPAGIERFVEIPWGEDVAHWIPALEGRGGFGKIRCGGVTPDAFPSVEELGRFLWAAVEADLTFKATAGLHHPLRGEFRLTYGTDAPQGEMHGYLNVLLAGALLRAEPRPEPAEVLALLEERSPEAFEVRERAIVWRGRCLDLTALESLRGRLLSVGSCSFAEPVQEIRGLGWIR